MCQDDYCNDHSMCHLHFQHRIYKSFLMTTLENTFLRCIIISMMYDILISIYLFLLQKLLLLGWTIVIQVFTISPLRIS